MTAVLDAPSPVIRDEWRGGGGVAARRAVIHWGWRLFRREWRQQLLVFALIVVAVAATIVGSAVSVNSPPPANSGFGSAQDAATFSGSDPHLAAQISSLEHRFGRVDVIENQNLTIPGSINTYQLRAQNPAGPFGGPMLSLVSGQYPTGAHEVAFSQPLASALDLKVGDVWSEGGTTRRVVGIVENPQSLLENFALVAPGQLATPTQVQVLFDANGVPASFIGPNVQSVASASQHNPFDPENISLAALTIGMILIALVAIGGFTVLAQRRLRSLGMLASLGATDKNVSLVVRANGVIVGVMGAVTGTVLGLVVWLAYRPRLESSVHHLVSATAVPWLVVVLAMVLAIVATYLAASRPARAVTRVPIVTALSGRPAPPKQVHRSAVPGIIFLVAAFFLLGYSGSTSGGTGSGGTPELLLGLVALIPGVILLAPFCLSLLARLGRRTPIAIRLALRDLARYRARSGSALAAISIGVLIAVLIGVLAAVRYGNTLDYAGPNVASNQFILYTSNGPGYNPPGLGQSFTNNQLEAMGKSARQIAASVGANQVVELDSTSATLDHASPSGNARNWNGSVYVGTPALLRAFGIEPSQVDPGADVLTARSGISTLSNMQLTWVTGPQKGFGTVTPGQGGPGQGGPGNRNGQNASNNTPCNPKFGCLQNPVIQQVDALPSGVSAPNTVVTEHAIHEFDLQPSLTGWLVQGTQPFTASQLNDARLAASAAGMTIETKNDQPTSSEVINWATVFGIALALAILAMSVGLIRSETAGDLRTLAATGASSYSRRTITAATAGALALLGAVLGTFAAYVGVIGWIRDNSLNGGISALGNVPVPNLLLILVGMPLVATAIGWLLAGREPSAIAHQPIE